MISLHLLANSNRCTFHWPANASAEDIAHHISELGQHLLTLKKEVFKKGIY